MLSSPSLMPDRKSKVAAVLLSLLVPGLGQIYCGQDNKGVFLAGIALLGCWATNGLTASLLSPVVALDAFLIAKKINRATPPQRWEYFPGIMFLNRVPPRLISTLIVLIVASGIVYHIVHYAADYHPNN